MRWILISLDGVRMSDAREYRMYQVAAHIERDIYFGGTRSLEVAGSLNAKRELAQFHQQVLDPEHIGDAAYE